MKFLSPRFFALAPKSPPSREAWIEMVRRYPFGALGGSPPSREAWIEIKELGGGKYEITWSPPSREAWIEIPGCSIRASTKGLVASLTGGVD